MLFFNALDNYCKKMLVIFGGQAGWSPEQPILAHWGSKNVKIKGVKQRAGDISSCFHGFLKVLLVLASHFPLA